jgi:hypothetical protein
LMKWERILDFTIALDPKFAPLCSSFVITSSCSYVGLVDISNLLFGILTPENIC